MADRYTIELKIEPSMPDHEPYSVYSWGVHEAHSVLAGQPRKVWEDSFDTVEQAKAAFPTAEMSHALLEPVADIGPAPANYYQLTVCNEVVEELEGRCICPTEHGHGWSSKKNGTNLIIIIPGQ